MHLNQMALRCAQDLIEKSGLYRVSVSRDETGTRRVDCGIHVRGGLEVGRLLAEVCLAGLGRVTLGPCDPRIWTGNMVLVHTDQPLAACLASQYAGWQIAGERYFAMGSGPMRAARGKEKVFQEIGFVEQPAEVIGVLEASKLPPPDVCHHIAAECHVDPEMLTLMVAPTASLAGTIQVVARTVETALHKMHEIGFDLKSVVSGFGTAPLPPVAKDDLSGIARTNDSVLYGGEVTLWVDTEDDYLAEKGAQVPSSSSSDHGRSFAELFQQYNCDFYKMDPLLFSPAVVKFINLASGREFRFGEFLPELVRKSFTH